MASFMTGLYPHVLDREFAQRGKKGGFLGSAFHTLAERLAAGGYDTAAFVSNVYLTKKNGFAQGFRHFDDTSGMFWAKPPGRWRRAQHVVDPALDWLDHAAPPFFLWVHVMDPHHPYEPPVMGPWEDPQRAAVHAATWERLTVDAHTQRLKDLRADRRPPAEGEVAYLVGRYDAEILHADRELARLRAGLEAHGFDDRNTVFVVTADHGEEFGDHGRMLHGHALFDELIRLPLVMRGPGIPAGERIAGQVQALDVMPTLLDLVGLLNAGAAGDSSALDGSTLRPALAGAEVPAHPALSFLLTRYVACRTPAWKLVVAFEPYDLSPPSWTPWKGLVSMARVTLGRPHRPSIGLWRLDADPGEQRNLASEDATTFREAYATLLAHRRAHPPRVVAASAPPGLDGPDRRTLRALGYVQ
jgi:arylsulfatase A-like enzyme